jgi:four helix bundle protein
MHNFRNLRIWHESIDLLEKIHAITITFPGEERFGLISQMRRSASSIPTNIAEGSSRDSQKEFKHFLSISLGSAYELFTHLKISARMGYIDENLKLELMNSTTEIERKISTFRKQLK